MNAKDWTVWNLNEVRRRSIKVWQSIPEDKLNWKPDENAMTCFEMIRHVLDSEYYYYLALQNGGSLSSYESPFEGRDFVSVQEELDFAEVYREEFMTYVGRLPESDLATVQIDRSESGYVRSLGDMLLRIAYHEAVHTGQLLDYLRTADIERVRVWD
ncbi:MAG: DinB family protein [Exiguobacterium sp.]